MLITFPVMRFTSPRAELADLRHNAIILIADLYRLSERSVGRTGIATFIQRLRIGRMPNCIPLSKRSAGFRPGP